MIKIVWGRFSNKLKLMPKFHTNCKLRKLGIRTTGFGLILK
jgi:hypothetical protein